ncbi:MAG: 4Fe-4S dicluster domain-containing protein [Thermodesulfobacteriota bacterium]
MPPVFDYEKCIGCGTCEELCPGDVIYMKQSDDGPEPYLRYPDECWHCGSCRQDCPEEAVTILFPPDMLSI